MSDLPKGWTACDLEVSVDILDNLRVPVNSDERQKRLGNIPYYGATGQVGWINDYLFDEELVLIGEDGAPFFDKSKPISYIIKGKSWVNNHAHVLRAKNKITTNQFLKYFLDQFDFHGFVNGTTRLKLNQGAMKKIPLLLPPLNEQKRIVEKLEKLLGKVEAVQARLDKIPAILKRFRQAILAAACSGRLTADWREENNISETAIQFLNRINLQREKSYNQGLEEAKHNKVEKPRKPNYLNYSIENCTKENSLPETWIVAPVGLLCDCIVPGRDKPKSFTGSIAWITLPNIINSEIQEETNQLKLSEQEIKEVKAKIIPVNSVIMSCIGRFGISAIVQRPVVINQQLHAFLKSEAILPQYLAFHIQTLTAYMNEVSTSTTVAYLNKDNCNSLPINLSPLEEQKEIVRRVEDLFKFADQIEARYKKARIYTDKLAQSILAKAFRGELVPQDERDEPASVLLARIKTEKETNQTKMSPKRKTASQAGLFE